MNIYSREDKFSRGIFLLLTIPLTLPFIYFNGAELKYLLPLSGILIWMVSIYYARLLKLYSHGGNARIYALSCIAMMAFNFSISFMISEYRSMAWAPVILSVLIAWYGKNIHEQYLQNT